MSIDLNIQIKINNKIASSLENPIRISNGVVVFSWDFDNVAIAEVNEVDGTLGLESYSGQSYFEIRIADNDINLGTDLFMGNYSSVALTTWTSRDWEYLGLEFKRGETYFGQIRIIDVASRTSDFETFSFVINRLPEVSNIELFPVSPYSSDEISLTYDYFDIDGDIEGDSIIRWFKNGVYQKNLDNVLVVNSSYISIGDIWYADVLPNDNYEYGARVSSNSAEVLKNQFTVLSARILPKNPNENDILKADYDIDVPSVDDDISVRWFVNDSLMASFNDSLFMRYDSTPGDTVRFEISMSSNTSFMSSEEVVISASDFLVYDIKIDGGIEPLEVSTITPNILWKNYIPVGQEIKYIHIEIGTFYDANNIYDSILETNKDNFTVPMNILQRGVDYYVSISISDTMEFNQKTSSHFRINGSRWNNSVSNSDGWTIETIYLIQSVGEYDSSQYQLFSISDGNFFAEVRLYNNRISFVSEEFIHVDIDSSGRNL